MTREEMEARFLRRVILIGLLITLILIAFKVSFAGLVVPLTRHDIYRPSWKERWLGKKPPEYYIVKGRVFNQREVPIRISARCQLIDLDESGVVSRWGEELLVEPAGVVTIYPQKSAIFKIHFPVQMGTSLLAVFEVAPEAESATAGKITVVRSTGYVLGVTFPRGKYRPDCVFTASKVSGNVEAVINNTNELLIEGRLTLVGGEKDVKKHFFLQAGRKRVFTIPDDGFSSCILDVVGRGHRLGIRLE